MILKQLFIFMAGACLATPVYSAPPPPIKQIEIVSTGSPYLQIESLKSRLLDAERLLALPAAVPGNIQTVLTENPEILLMIEPNGWEHVLLAGIGDAELKQHGTRTLLKMPASKASAGLLTIAHVAKSMVRCGGGNICFSLDTSGLVTK